MDMARADSFRDRSAPAAPGAHLQDLPLMAVCAVRRIADGAVIGFTHGDAGLAVQPVTATGLYRLHLEEAGAASYVAAATPAEASVAVVKL